MGEFDDKGISKVFFTNFRCKPDEGPVDKLKRLIKSAGFGDAQGGHGAFLFATAGSVAAPPPRSARRSSSRQA